jgi:hypothetical protein
VDRQSYKGRLTHQELKTDAINAKMLYELHKVIKPENVLVFGIDRKAEQLSLYLGSYELMIKTRITLANYLHRGSVRTDTPFRRRTRTDQRRTSRRDGRDDYHRQYEPPHVLSCPRSIPIGTSLKGRRKISKGGLLPHP